MTIRPFQSQLLNIFVFTSETVYVICCVSTLVFSDSEPSLLIKYGFSIILCTTVVLLIFNNFLMVGVLLYRGTNQLKHEIKLGKQKRIDEEIAWNLERNRIKGEIGNQDNIRKS